MTQPARITKRREQPLASVLGAAAVRCIPIGTPAYEAFAMTRPQAKAQQHAEVLLTNRNQLLHSFCLGVSEEALPVARRAAA